MSPKGDIINVSIKPKLKSEGFTFYNGTPEGVPLDIQGRYTVTVTDK